ncbi:MAG TPA: hypothetical protein VGV69_00795 [Solirubrobacterales bacterium]|nr:hypothetical protein [Solirubrobacterales bacterium]
MTASAAPEQAPLPEEKLLRLADWAGPVGRWAPLATVLIGVLNLIPKSGRPTWELSIGMGWIGVGLMYGALARWGLLVDREGITVKGVRQGRHWAWSEVGHFEIRRSVIRAGLRIHLVDGKVVGLRGLFGVTARERRLSEAWLAELNRRAAAAV